MLPPSLPLRALLATALLLGCGTSLPEGSERELAEVAARVCEGTSCTAGYCTNEGESAVCRCTPVEAALGVACEVDEVGDFDADPLRVPTLQLPVGPTTGQLHRRDFDTFAFSAVAGHAYRFTCTPEGFPLCAVQLYGERGSLDGVHETHEGTTTVLTYVAPVSGRYTVQLAAWPTGASEQRGTYRYTLAEVADAEGAPEAGGRAVLADGTPFTGALDYPGDVDGFGFDAQAGHVYRARCTGPSLAHGFVGPGVALYGPGSELVDGAYELAVELAVGGPHVLHVRSYAPLTRTPYACTLEDLGPDDHGDSAAAATPLAALPAQPAGVLETRDDQDFFSFPALAGHTYDLVCDRATQWVCDTAYIDHERRTLPATPITVAEDRTLFVRVHGGNEHRTGAPRLGRYAVTVRDLGADQGGSIADAVPLSPGAPVTGLIGSAWESDYFRLEAEPGRVYRIAVDLPSSAQVGVFRAAAPDVNLLRYQYARAGYFEVEQAEAIIVQLRGPGGPYTLQLEELAADDHADVREAATPVAPPSLRAEGLLDTVEDVDWFALELQQRRYAVRSFQTDWSAQFTLVEADGVTPVPAESWTGDRLPRTAGRHYLKVLTPSIYFDVQNRYLYELSPR